MKIEYSEMAVEQLRAQLHYLVDHNFSGTAPEDFSDEIKGMVQQLSADPLRGKLFHGAKRVRTHSPSPKFKWRVLYRYNESSHLLTVLYLKNPYDSGKHLKTYLRDL